MGLHGGWGTGTRWAPDGAAAALEAGGSRLQSQARFWEAKAGQVPQLTAGSHPAGRCGSRLGTGPQHPRG